MSTYAFDYLLNNCETQAKTFAVSVSRSLQFAKSCEQFLGVCPSETHSCVFDFHEQSAVWSTEVEGANHYLSTRLGKLNRIANQVDDYLLQPSLVTNKFWQEIAAPRHLYLVNVR